MTQSPADEYEKPVRSADRGREPVDSRATLQRTLDRTRDRLRRAFNRARDGLVRCVGAVRRLAGAGASATARSTEYTTGFDGPNRSDHLGGSGCGGRESSATVSHLAIDAEEASNDAETSLPERDRPFTEPPRDDVDGNPPDPVARVEGERLTVELPDQPEASITSDVWERVEP